MADECGAKRIRKWNGIRNEGSRFLLRRPVSGGCPVHIYICIARRSIDTLSVLGISFLVISLPRAFFFYPCFLFRRFSRSCNTTVGCVRVRASPVGQRHLRCFFVCKIRRVGTRHGTQKLSKGTKDARITLKVNHSFPMDGNSSESSGAPQRPRDPGFSHYVTLWILHNPQCQYYAMISNEFDRLTDIHFLQYLRIMPVQPFA